MTFWAENEPPFDEFSIHIDGYFFLFRSQKPPISKVRQKYLILYCLAFFLTSCQIALIICCKAFLLFVVLTLEFFEGIEITERKET